jgi:hypothetical protein
VNRAALRFLLSPEGRRLLAETAAAPITPHTHVQIASRLRRQTEHAAAVLETAVLRQRAMTKFSRAAQMYFTRDGLEQASSEAVAAYRARRFARLGCRWVADLGCGLGGDAMALAASAQVIGLDRDHLRLALARQNVAAYGRGERFHPVQADLRQTAPLPVDACFFDPARRDERGRRIYSVHDYRPPLSLIDPWRARMPAGVKISPGVAYAQVPAAAELEFISLAGAVKDGALWFGELRTGARRRATLLPGAHTLTDNDLPETAVAVTPPRAYLYEPDNAVIRAHLVQALAARLNATQIDPQIAYLTADQAQETPFARCWRVRDAFPFHLKRLRAYLRERNVGRVTVKKRGSPLEPEELARRLRLSGPEARVLFLTQGRGEPLVIVGEEMEE